MQMRRNPISMQMILNMQHTASRRGNNIIEFLKIFDKKVITTFGEMLKPRISHRLAAAGLIGRVNNFTSKLFQQLQRSDAYLRIKLVYVTRYKQSDSHDQTYL
jgi:hypothetical protein